MPSYTPYLAEATQNIAGAMQSRGIKRQQAAQNKLAGDAYMGDPQALQEIMRINPDMGMKLLDHIQRRKDNQAQKDLQAQSAKVAKRKQFKIDYDDIMNNIGRQFNTFEESQEYGNSRISDLFQRYPEIMNQLGDDQVYDENDFNLAKQLLKSTKDGMFSAKTEFYPGDVSIQADPSGNVIVKVGGELVEGQARADAIERSRKIESDIKDADAERRVETQRDIEQVKNAEESSNQAFEMVDKIRQNILNLEEVTPLIGQGANTGPISDYFPSFIAATKRLEVLQKRLGLDVVGSVRFGALSKGELDLALSVALPLGLEGDDLINWVNDKIAAQRKLATYFEDQAIFLSNGGTQSGWLEKIKAKRVATSQKVLKFDSQGNPVQ